ncbi:hypothetical protein SKAU_G00084630 [Synaphobranchus kaupii]|uniref:Uncharacterized protein n=1 Tax=Synaphobranchus kaupii TaxID=118154 RepID=A0A9Q1FVI2_SYNKA|nr:hypothetical protein SKAU_G00084630 [Synaphobranchus kaupii]
MTETAEIPVMTVTLLRTYSTGYSTPSGGGAVASDDPCADVAALAKSVRSAAVFRCKRDGVPQRRSGPLRFSHSVDTQ